MPLKDSNPNDGSGNGPDLNGGVNAEADDSVKFYRTTARPPVFSGWENLPAEFGTGEAEDGGTNLDEAALIRELCIPVLSQYETSGGSRVQVSQDLAERVIELKKAADSKDAQLGDVYGDYAGDDQDRADPLLVRGRISYDDLTRVVDMSASASDRDFIPADRQIVKDADANGASIDRKFDIVYDFETYAIWPTSKAGTCNYKRVRYSEFVKSFGKPADEAKIKREAFDKMMDKRSKASSIFDGKGGLFSFFGNDFADFKEQKGEAPYSNVNSSDKTNKTFTMLYDYVLIRRRFVSGERIFRAGFGIPVDSENAEYPEEIEDKRWKFKDTYEKTAFKAKLRRKIPNGRYGAGTYYEDAFGFGKYDEYPPAKFLASRVKRRMESDAPLDPAHKEDDDIGASKDLDEVRVQFKRWVAKHKISDQYRMEGGSAFTDWLKNRTTHSDAPICAMANDEDSDEEKRYFTSEQVDSANYDIGSGIFGTQNVFDKQPKIGTWSWVPFSSLFKTEKRYMVRKYDAYPCAIFAGKMCDANRYEARCWMKAHTIDDSVIGRNFVDEDRFAVPGDGITGKDVLDYIHSCGGHLDDSAEKVLSETEMKFDAYPDFAYEIPYYVEAGVGGDSNRVFRSMYVGKTAWRFDKEGRPVKKNWVRALYHWMRKHEKLDADHSDKGDITKKRKYKDGEFDNGDKMVAHIWYGTLIVKVSDYFEDIDQGVFRYENDDGDTGGHTSRDITNETYFELP